MAFFQYLFCPHLQVNHLFCLCPRHRFACTLWLNTKYKKFTAFTLYIKNDYDHKMKELKKITKYLVANIKYN